MNLTLHLSEGPSTIFFLFAHEQAIFHFLILEVLKLLE